MANPLPQYHYSEKSRPWYDRRLYRYMEKQWVDQLRLNGSLRISRISKYKDTGDAREDKSEGFLENRFSGPGHMNREQAKRILGKDVKSITFKDDWKGSLLTTSLNASG